MPVIPKPIDCIQIDWVSVDGNTHADWFCTIEYGRKQWGNVCGDLSYVHICNSPRLSLLRYLLDLPLVSVHIQEIA